MDVVHMDFSTRENEVYKVHVYTSSLTYSFKMDHDTHDRGRILIWVMLGTC